MRTPTGEPQPSTPSAADPQTPSPEPGGEVRTFLDALRPQCHADERRSARRYPYPYLVRLTPVAGDGVTAEGESVVVVGKHLSEQGLGFYHPRPLPHRRMIASLEAACGTRLAFLIDLTWCRFLKQGWYESGGRFVQPVSY